MHAHQSKAPRATLQHTHTYSTNSTAGTDQFICFDGVLTASQALWWQSCFLLSIIRWLEKCMSLKYVTAVDARCICKCDTDLCALLLMLLLLLRAWNGGLPEDDV